MAHVLKEWCHNEFTNKTMYFYYVEDSYANCIKSREAVNKAHNKKNILMQEEYLGEYPYHGWDDENFKRHFGIQNDDTVYASGDALE